ncbi:hypothetical protein ACERK3_09725 [Phycisphaerales bacterium AB-hyl4]|uniref:Uncharacterized protein n=1 Tax=Natronomicrosphaera hydrolytica TaxID=3242702 RepID=A0ABV4U6W7_9BACT
MQAINWHQLDTIVVEEWFSKPTVKAVNELNARITDMQTARASLEQDAVSMSQADVSALSPDDLYRQDFAQRRFTLLQEEIRVREDVNAVLPMIRSDRYAIRDKYREQLAEAREWVKGELVKLGWLDLDKNVPHPSKITPAFTESHPTVVELRNTVKSLESDDAMRLARNKNTEAVEAIKRQLAGSRDRLVTV